MVSRSYSQLADLSDPLKPLLGKSADEFARIAMSSSEAAASMAEGVRAMDSDAINAGRRLVGRNCRSCHRLDLPDSNGTVKQVFAKTRRELGIGDGHYQVGHDLRITHHDRERMQVMADALRCAALLANADASR